MANVANVTLFLIDNGGRSARSTAMAIGGASHLIKSWRVKKLGDRTLETGEVDLWSEEG
jgi:hypothetical protein